MRELSLPIALHLSAALPAIALGIAVLLRRKGTSSHKLLGWIWVAAMALVAGSSFWIVELRADAGFSLLHLLSLWTLTCLACAIWAIKRGRVGTHQGFMVGVFIGLLAAGIASLAPDRLLNQSLQTFSGPLGEAPLR
jgi:uncharacterized membrane protein